MKKFVKHTVLFFIPVILGYLAVEYTTRQLPMGFKDLSRYYEENKTEFEVLVLGSSQIKDAINPELLQIPTLNLGSGNQHHDTDFKILKGLLPHIPNLKTVVLEVSYSHFELPHNGKDFWKNAVYYEYYGVNAFERRTWFKDRLVYLSNPQFFSERLLGHYKGTDPPAGFSKYGFDTLNYGGRFQDLNYSEEKIAKTKFRLNYKERPEVFQNNAALFNEMLDFLKEKELNVIICSVPMYKTFLSARNPNILRRRDSILSRIEQDYSNVRMFRKEEDTVRFKVKDYWNQSHLNPDGAKKFTEEFEMLLTED